VQVFISNNPNILTKNEWKVLGIELDSKNVSGKDGYGTLFTRDTYRALQIEIKTMPLRELALLPEEIQNWVRGLRGEKQLQQSMSTLIKQQDEHVDALINAASRLVNNLNPYLLENDFCLRDYITDTTKKDDKDLEEQIHSDIPTKWLLSHMKEEFHILGELDDWADIPTKMINVKLLRRLTVHAAQGSFPGTCEICKTWGGVV
jgi:hypothetical protein